ncbi:MAG: glycosyltransferase [Leptolyngbyaceae cyanobacterium]
MRKKDGLNWMQPWSWQALGERVQARAQLRAIAQRLTDSGLFDAGWYLLENPDVAQAGINPLRHYLIQGASEGRNPSPLFDSAWYLAQSVDVAESGVNPLLHYVEQGAGEGRDPHPLFTSGWYLEQNADVAAAGINPLLHYLWFGGFEGRNPNLSFDSGWYLARNSDVAAAGIHPFLHYLYQGVAEGRSPSPWNDTRFIQRAASYHGSFRAAAGDVFAQSIAQRQARERPPLWRRLMTRLSPGGQQGAPASPSSSDKSAAVDHAIAVLLPDQAVPQQIVRQPNGNYALVPAAGHYTYIPPARPSDLAQQLAAMARRPCFSIVVPVYNTPIDLLTQMTESVYQQWYDNWELILVDDASPLPATREALSALHHPQLKIRYLEQNQGIAGATNAAIAEASGDYIVFLDHDDELTPDCLYELSRCINDQNPDFIYSDEDKLNAGNGFQEPHFKPDWSPDTLMSTMYTCHVACVRRSVVEQVGGLRTQYNGCQDWDFILRVTEYTQHIAHIPKVLYHWRIIPGSTAADIAAKPYILAASQLVRQDALRRRGVTGSVEPVTQMAGYFRVAYDLADQSTISIIVPSQRDWDNWRRCVDAIVAQTTDAHYEIIGLMPVDASAEMLRYGEALTERGVPTQLLVTGTAASTAQAMNRGAHHASGELLLFLSETMEVIQPDWLRRLGGFAQQTHIGAVGAKLLMPTGQQVRHAGMVNLRSGPAQAFMGQSKDAYGYFMRNLLEYNWLAVAGDCLMVERAKFNQVNGFCETLAIAYSDVDLGIRLYEAGYYNVVCQAVQLVDQGPAITAPEIVDGAPARLAKAELHQLYARHPQYFEYDPFFSPNLQPNSLHFDYAN